MPQTAPATRKIVDQEQKLNQDTQMVLNPAFDAGNRERSDTRDTKDEDSNSSGSQGKESPEALDLYDTTGGEESTWFGFTEDVKEDVIPENKQKKDWEYYNPEEVTHSHLDVKATLRRLEKNDEKSGKVAASENNKTIVFDDFGCEKKATEADGSDWQEVKPKGKKKESKAPQPAPKKNKKKKKKNKKKEEDATSKSKANSAAIVYAFDDTHLGKTFAAPPAAEDYADDTYGDVWGNVLDDPNQGGYLAIAPEAETTAEAQVPQTSQAPKADKANALQAAPGFELYDFADQPTADHDEIYSFAAAGEPIRRAATSFGAKAGAQSSQQEALYDTASNFDAQLQAALNGKTQDPRTENLYTYASDALTEEATYEVPSEIKDGLTNHTYDSPPALNTGSEEAIYTAPQAATAEKPALLQGLRILGGDSTVEVIRSFILAASASDSNSTQNDFYAEPIAVRLMRFLEQDWRKQLQRAYRIYDPVSQAALLEDQMMLAGFLLSWMQKNVMPDTEGMSPFAQLDATQYRNFKKSVNKCLKRQGIGADNAQNEGEGLYSSPKTLNRQGIDTAIRNILTSIADKSDGKQHDRQMQAFNAGSISGHILRQKMAYDPSIPLLDPLAAKVKTESKNYPLASYGITLDQWLNIRSALNAVKTKLELRNTKSDQKTAIESTLKNTATALIKAYQHANQTGSVKLEVHMSKKLAADSTLPEIVVRADGSFDEHATKGAPGPYLCSISPNSIRLCPADQKTITKQTHRLLAKSHCQVNQTAATSKQSRLLTLSPWHQASVDAAESVLDKGVWQTVHSKLEVDPALKPDGQCCGMFKRFAQKHPKAAGAMIVLGMAATGGLLGLAALPQAKKIDTTTPATGANQDKTPDSSSTSTSMTKTNTGTTKTNTKFNLFENSSSTHTNQGSGDGERSSTALIKSSSRGTDPSQPSSLGISTQPASEDQSTSTTNSDMTKTVTGTGTSRTTVTTNTITKTTVTDTATTVSKTTTTLTKTATSTTRTVTKTSLTTPTTTTHNAPFKDVNNPTKAECIAEFGPWNAANCDNMIDNGGDVGIKCSIVLGC